MNSWMDCLRKVPWATFSASEDRVQEPVMVRGLSLSRASDKTGLTKAPHWKGGALSDKDVEVTFPRLPVKEENYNHNMADDDAFQTKEADDKTAVTQALDWCRRVCRADLIACAVTGGVLILVVALLAGQQFVTPDGQQVPYWKVGFVLIMTVGMIVLMTFDFPIYPSEVVLITGAAIFGLAGIIPNASVLAGLSDTTVTSVALLFPMAKAISDTGALEVFVGAVLGHPKSTRMAVFKLCLLVGPLSAIVNNTPVTAIMVPVLRSWCTRLGFDVAQLAMPLAFSAQLGGGLTLMGSPTNFAARKTYRQENFDLSFFLLTPVAAPLFVFGTIFFTFVAPIMLGKGRCGSSKEPESEQLPALTRQFSIGTADPFFRVSFHVNDRGAFSGGTINVKAAGFDRLPGVRAVELVLRDDVPVWEKGADAPDLFIRSGDRLIFSAIAEGVVALRNTSGITISTEQDSRMLGSGRKRRRVFEVEVPITSDLMGARLDSSVLRESYGCAVLAVRGRLSGEKKKSQGIEGQCGEIGARHR